MLSKLKFLLPNQNSIKNVSLIQQNIRNFYNPPQKPPAPRYSDIRFEYIKEKDYNEASSVINKIIFDDEPMSKAFKLKKSSFNRRILKKVWYRGLERNQSIAAKNKWDDTIKGVIINYDIYQDVDYNDTVALANEIKGPSTEDLYDLLIAWSEIIKKAKSFECGTQILHMDMLAVDPEWRKLKIADTLVRESIQLAKLNGFEFVTVDCTSPITEHIIKKIGFEKYWHQQYKDFPGHSKDKELAQGYINVYKKVLDYRTEPLPSSLILKTCVKKPPHLIEFSCEPDIWEK